MEKWAKDMNRIFIEKETLKAKNILNQEKEKEIAGLFKGPTSYL